MNKTNFLKEKAHQLRSDMFEMCVNAGHGHISSGFSCLYLSSSEEICIIHFSNSSAGLAFNAGNEPITPALHWAITNSG